MTPAEVKQWRRDYLVRGPCCKCGGMAHDLHEIIGGPHRTAAMKERACVLRVCRLCHDYIQGASIPWQLALKLLSDPEGYDVAAFCEAWRRPVSSVDAASVLFYVRQILIDRKANRG